MSTNRSENEQKLREIAVTLNQARRHLNKGNPVVYQAEDVTHMGGRHRGYAVHYPDQGRMVVELPEKPEHLIMTLHAIEAVLFVVKKSLKRNPELALPALEFVQFGGLAAEQNEIFLAKTVLTVQVDSTHYVKENKKSKSSHKSVESIAKQYYAQLLALLEQEAVLATYPSNIMFVEAHNGEKQPELNEVVVSTAGDKRESAANKRVPTGKIQKMPIAKPVSSLEGLHETV